METDVKVMSEEQSAACPERLCDPARSGDSLCSSSLTREHPSREGCETTSGVCRIGTQTILVVDDDRAVREAVARAVEAGGYRVITAGDGPEALDVLGESGADIALVVLDVVMPRMCAAEVLARLARLSSPVRVLLVSGHCPAAQEGAISHPRVLGFLEKPFSMRQLLDTIAVVLRRAPGRHADKGAHLARCQPDGFSSLSDTSHDSHR